jgi:cell division protein FtsI/penicillin-binding protein 2
VRLVTIICALCAVIIVGRLYVLQILHGDMYTARADAQFSAPRRRSLTAIIFFYRQRRYNLIAAATMQNVGTTTERKRFYPGGSLAAQELGFVAYNNDNTQKGRYGLERYYDQTLTRPSRGSLLKLFC